MSFPDVHAMCPHCGFGQTARGGARQMLCVACGQLSDLVGGARWLPPTPGSTACPTCGMIRLYDNEIRGYICQYEDMHPKHMERKADCVILRAEGERLLMLITSDGKMQEFNLPISVASALLSQAGTICAQIISQRPVDAV